MCTLLTKILILKNQLFLEEAIIIVLVVDFLENLNIEHLKTYILLVTLCYTRTVHINKIYEEQFSF